MARDTSARYQNSLIYDPSREIGAHPERTLYTAPGATTGNSYARTPLQFAPEEAWLNSLGRDGLGASRSASLFGDENMPVAASALTGLIGPGMKGLEAIGRQIVDANATTRGISILPPEQAAPWLETQPLVTSAPAGAGALFDGVSVMPAADTAAMLANEPLTISSPAGGLGTLTDSLGTIGGTGFAPGFSAAPVDALADFGGGADAALGNMMGTQGAADAAAGGFNPYGAGAGIVGGYLGNMAGTAVFGAGDAQQRPWTSGIGAAAGGLGGGIAAGAAFGSSFGPIGTLVGAFAGAFLGAGAGGSPDLPLGYFGGSVGSDGQFQQDAAGALNGARVANAAGMSNSLFGTLQQRAAADGLSINPGFVNQQVFNAGFSADDPGSPFFYNAGNRPAAASEKDYRTGSYDQLADFAYGDLRNRGVFAAPGSAPSWADVQTNLQQQGDASERFEYGGESGGQTGQFAGHGWAQNQYMVPGTGLVAPDLSAMGMVGTGPESYVYGSAPQFAYTNTSLDVGNSG